MADETTTTSPSKLANALHAISAVLLAAFGVGCLVAATRPAFAAYRDTLVEVGLPLVPASVAAAFKFVGIATKEKVAAVDAAGLANVKAMIAQSDAPSSATDLVKP